MKKMKLYSDDKKWALAKSDKEEKKRGDKAYCGVGVNGCSTYSKYATSPL